MLRNASLKGYVFPPQNGWVTFVASDGLFEPDERIIKSNPGFLLHYVSAEDHGWSFTFFDKEQIKITYRCDWNDDVSIDDSLCSEEIFRTFLSDFGVVSTESTWSRLRSWWKRRRQRRGPVKDIWPLMHPADFDEAMEEETSTFW